MNTVQKASSSLIKFPYYWSGKVLYGLKRGTTVLGTPTANIKADGIDLPNGVYYGLAQIMYPSVPSLTSQEEESNPKSAITAFNSRFSPIYNFVASLGSSTGHDVTDSRLLEVHLLHRFQRPFYGANLRVAVIDKIRDDRKYDSIQDLIKSIQLDIEHAIKELSDNPHDWIPAIESGFFIKNALMAPEHHKQVASQ